MIAGQILWIDFRRDALPKESNRLRPGIVVEDCGLFSSAFPNVVVVPCTTALTFEVPELCVQIEPDGCNGFDRMNWAIAHNVTTASKAHIVKETAYHVSPEHLAEIRARIIETLDL
jgi:mRNA-degrading endonuclease toxin of MazEF toxin-antitoxin module